VICKAYGALALWLLGFPEAAQRQSEQAIEMSQALSPNSQSVALHFAAMTLQLCRDHGRSRAHAEACAAIASEHGFPFWLAGSSAIGGWALAACGDAEAGINRLKQGIADWRATGSATYLTYYYGLLADSLLTKGETEEALHAVEEGLALVEITDERMVEGELQRLRGLVRQQTAASDPAKLKEAEADFRHALQIASRQEAKSLELRAAISLTQHQDRLGIKGDGRELLAQIMSEPVEASHSRDRRDAEMLLGETS
jgi:predicted ATPase